MCNCLVVSGKNNLFDVTDHLWLLCLSTSSLKAPKLRGEGYNIDVPLMAENSEVSSLHADQLHISVLIVDGLLLMKIILFSVNVYQNKIHPRGNIYMYIYNFVEKMAQSVNSRKSFSLVTSIITQMGL